MPLLHLEQLVLELLYQRPSVLDFGLQLLVLRGEKRGLVRAVGELVDLLMQVGHLLEVLLLDVFNIKFLCIYRFR